MLVYTCYIGVVLWVYIKSISWGIPTCSLSHIYMPCSLSHVHLLHIKTLVNDFKTIYKLIKTDKI